MRSNLKLLAVTGVAAGFMAVTELAASTPEPRTYRVTLVNLTSGQPFSPPVAATHSKSIRMFEVGELASDELAAIAQGGDQGPMLRRFSTSDKVTQAVDAGRPVTRTGQVGDSVTFELTAAPATGSRS